MNNCKLPPTLTDFAKPAPPETTSPPVFTVVELSVELIVALPVAAPIEIVVAAPNAFIVVAFVLKTANVPSPVVTPVPNEGCELNTNDPDPVSSVNADDIAEEVVEAETVPPEIVRIPVDELRF